MVARGEGGIKRKSKELGTQRQASQEAVTTSLNPKGQREKQSMTPRSGWESRGGASGGDFNLPFGEEAGKIPLPTTSSLLLPFVL